MLRISQGHIWPKVSLDSNIYSSLDLKEKKFIDSISGKSRPEYNLSAHGAGQNSVVNVHFEDIKPISRIESIQMAIFLADKYNNFSYLWFGKKQGAALDIGITNNAHRSDVGESISLYMRSYTNQYLAKDNSLKFLMFRETLSNRVQMIRYKVIRLLNISKLKFDLILQSQKLRTKP
jgi:hypothetical protein